MMMIIKIVAAALLYVSIACLLGMYLGTRSREDELADALLGLDERTSRDINELSFRLTDLERSAGILDPEDEGDAQGVLWMPPRGELDPRQYLGDFP